MDEISEFRSRLNYSDRKIWIEDTILHPAKAHLGMLQAIILEYTNEGDTILDPMAGIGSTGILAMLHNRNCIMVEYEEKFCKTIKTNIELNKKQSRLQPIGHAEIIQGDARFLSRMFKSGADSVVMSPPYSESLTKGRKGHTYFDSLKKTRQMTDTKDDNIANLPHGDIDNVIFSPPYAEQSDRPGGITTHKNNCNCNYCRKNKRNLGNIQGYVKSTTNPNNIGNLKYGDIDAVMFSPPFGPAQKGGGIAQKGYEGKHGKDQDLHLRHDRPLSDSKNNISNLPFGNIDSIITSPPYEESAHDPSLSDETIRKTEESQGRKYTRRSFTGAHAYSDDTNNLGNLKGQTYLQAMRMVYQGCYDVLRENGIMVLITKNFIRHKKIIPLDQHTIKLCESMGFTLIKRHYRKITNPSFWRILYKKKHGLDISYEDILVFRK